jgi:hypothetical protein
MAGAAGVDDTIRPCGILSGRPFAKLMSSLRDEILAMDDLNQTIFAYSNAINNLPSMCQNRLHRPRYKNFLFGADRASLTFWTYNLEYFTVIFIIHCF